MSTNAFFNSQVRAFLALRARRSVTFTLGTSATEYTGLPDDEENDWTLGDGHTRDTTSGNITALKSELPDPLPQSGGIIHVASGKRRILRTSHREDESIPYIVLYYGPYHQ